MRRSFCTLASFYWLVLLGGNARNGSIAPTTKSLFLPAPTRLLARASLRKCQQRRTALGRTAVGLLYTPAPHAPQAHSTHSLRNGSFDKAIIVLRFHRPTFLGWTAPAHAHARTPLPDTAAPQRVDTTRLQRAMAHYHAGRHGSSRARTCSERTRTALMPR